MRIVLGVLEPDGGEVRWRGRPVDLETRAPLRLHAGGARPVPEDARARPARLLRLAARPAARRRSGGRGPLARAARARRPRRRPRRVALARQPAAGPARRRARARPRAARARRAVLGPRPGRRRRAERRAAELADEGVPVVFSSHQLELVERLCESVAIVKDGRLVASGRVDELRERGTQRPDRARRGPGGRRGVARAACRAPRSSTAARPACSSRCATAPGPTPCSTPRARPARVTHFALERPTLSELFRKAVAA